MSEVDFRKLLPLLELVGANGKQGVSLEKLASLVHNPYALRVPQNLVSYFSIPKEWGTYKEGEADLHHPSSRVKALYGGFDGMLYVVTCEDGMNVAHIIQRRTQDDPKTLNPVDTFEKVMTWKLFKESEATSTGFKIFGLFDSGNCSFPLEPAMLVYLNLEDAVNIMGEYTTRFYVGSRPLGRGSLDVVCGPATDAFAKERPVKLSPFQAEPYGWERYLTQMSALSGSIISEAAYARKKGTDGQINLGFAKWPDLRDDYPRSDVDRHPEFTYRWTNEVPGPWFTCMSPLFYEEQSGMYCYWAYDATDAGNPMICLMKAPNI